jgi:hypothetical protein
MMVLINPNTIAEYRDDIVILEHGTNFQLIRTVKNW